MILAQELRIGNFVMVNGEIEEICGICEDYPFLNTIKYGACVVEYMDLDPIPLTEEIFSRINKEGKFIKIVEGECDSIWVEQFIDDKFYLTNNEADVLNNTEIKFLHQLQNLFFALTQEELKLN